MPLQTFNFMNMPLVKPDYSGFEDFIPNAQEAYYRPKRLEAETSLKQAQSKQAQLNAWLTEKFGEREHEGKLLGQDLENDKLGITNSHLNESEMKRIALMGAQARHHNASAENIGSGGGRIGITDNMRRWQAAPSILKQDMVAQLVGGGWSTDAAIKGLSEGRSIEEMLMEKGVNPSEVEKQYAITQPNITKMQNRQALSAGHEVISDAVTKGLAHYPNSIAGYSPAQVWDMHKGDSVDKQIDFYSALALEDESAVIAITKAGGNVNMHAVDNMVKKSLGNRKVIPAQMSKEVLTGVRNRVKEKLTEAAEAEKDSLTRPAYYKEQKAKKQQMQQEALRNANPQMQAPQGMQQPQMQQQMPQQNAVPPGMVQGMKNGKMYVIPAQAADAFIAAGGQLNGQ